MDALSLYISSDSFTGLHSKITKDRVLLMQSMLSYFAAYVYISSASHLSYIILKDFPPKQ